MSDSQQVTNPSIDQIEADIAATRAHLTATVDELVTRSQPKEIIRRQSESARVAFAGATRTSDGAIRVERLAGVLGAVAALLITIGLVRRQRS
ncbi:DUF3618 domain-containing protein [Lapillicoccus sp.]|uniref:DUF3618 domain-containing protein n=1 Tax=Lapillicoccus sp. TaxID=1909287 RepID=UPI003983B9DA